MFGSHERSLTYRCIRCHYKQCIYRPVVRVWISTLADTLGTKVLSVLGILSKGIFSCFTYFVVSYILILQYDYLKLVYVKMYYAYMCYMMLSLNKIITKKSLHDWKMSISYWRIK